MVFVDSAPPKWQHHKYSTCVWGAGRVGRLVNRQQQINTFQKMFEISRNKQITVDLDRDSSNMSQKIEKKVKNYRLIMFACRQCSTFLL